jgi:hypothetical protein
MSTIINNIMDDTDYRKKLQEMLLANERKQAERSQGYRGTTYSDRTPSSRVTKPKNPYSPTSSPPPPSPTPRTNSDEVAITILTEENKKLKKQYSDLLGKTTRIVTAYKELQKENETLKKKKVKRESVANSFAGIGKGVQKGYDKIILWFKT